GRARGGRERLRALALPLSPEAIVALPAEQLRAALGSAGTPRWQLALARDIRRRGRNKEAARRCRRRRLEALAGLRAELGRLGRERERLLRARGLAERALGTLRGELERVTRLVLGDIGDTAG
ncbi:NFE2 factor, partial [Chaetorhynchus papuensis]|nr:NFE2 factor [Chaetorhynchus papuensis]